MKKVVPGTAATLHATVPTRAPTASSYSVEYIVDGLWNAKFRVPTRPMSYCGGDLIDWVTHCNNSRITARKWVIEKRVPAQLFHHTTPPRSTIRINSTKCGQHAPNQSTTKGSIRAGDHDGEKTNDKKGNGKVQQQQHEKEGKHLLDSKKKTRRASIDASTSAMAAANQQSTFRHVSDGHDS